MAHQSVEQLLDVGSGRPHVRTQRNADRSGGALGQFSAQSHDRPADIVGPQRRDGFAPRGHRVDDDGGQRIGDRSLEGSLPAAVDLDEVEEGADHPVDAGEPFGAGLRPRLVERQLERVGPRDPAVSLGLGDAPVLLGRIGDRGSGHDRGFGVGVRTRERRLGRLGVGEHRPLPVGLRREPLALLSECPESGLRAGDLEIGPFESAAQRHQLASDF